MLKLLLIIPWIGAGAAAYWFTETNGSQIKKHDPALYEKISNDADGKVKEGIKADLEDKKKLLTASEAKLKELEAIDASAISDDEKAALKELKEITVPKQKKEVEIAQNIDGKLWMPILSISNIGWFAGIFLGAGLIGHFITKKILGMFSENKE